MKPLPAATLLLALGLAACAQAPTVEELQAFDRSACDAAGFAAGGDAHGLCLLLQDTNRRLEHVERRLGFLELDMRVGFNTGCRYHRC